MEGLDELVREFLAESAENLSQLEAELAELARDPDSGQLLASAFRTLHTIKGTGGCLAFSRVEELAHAGEALLARLRDRRLALTPQVSEALRQLTDALSVLLGWIATSGSDTGPDIGPALAAVRAAAGTDPGPAEPMLFLDEPMLILDEPMLVLDEPMLVLDEPMLVLDQPPMPAGERTRPASGCQPASPAQRRTLAEPPAGRSRLQPMERAWSRFPRLVRTLGDRCGKQVRLQLSGSEIELERGVLAAIRDPLTHLVRNAVDHGIEPAEQRLAAGKPAHGTLRLQAHSAAGQVVIEVADDGAGIDLQAVGSDALARGLVTGDQLAGMTATELAELVFQPGLSTARAVTRVSGRGVGMDVVKTNVESIGGSVEIDSVPGRGTVCRLRLPSAAAVEMLPVAEVAPV